MNRLISHIISISIESITCRHSNIFCCHIPHTTHNTRHTYVCTVYKRQNKIWNAKIFSWIELSMANFAGIPKSILSHHSSPSPIIYLSMMHMLIIHTYTKKQNKRKHFQFLVSFGKFNMNNEHQIEYIRPHVFD